MTEAIILGPFNQVLTMEGLAHQGHLLDDDLVLQNNAGIQIVDGRVAAIGPIDTLEGTREELSGPLVAVPGLIDAHTHLCFAGNRARDYALRLSGNSYAEVAALGGGILDTVRQTRAATEEALIKLTVGRLALAAAQGVTTCEIKSGYGLTVESELKMLRAIAQLAKRQPVAVVPTCLAAHTLPPEFTARHAYLEHLLEALLPLVLSEGLAHRIDIFVEQGAFSVDDAKAYLLQAKQMGFDLCLHADQFSRGGALLAAEVEALSADHLEQSTSEDFDALQSANVIPIVLPGSTLGLGLPFPSAKEMLDHDLPLVIASDWNPGSAPMGQLLTQAALLGAAQHLSMAETWAAITFRAAKALKFEDRGTLVRGQRADIAIFPCADYREILYHQGSMQPIATYIAGKKVHVG